jgi:hypothetical protein
VADISGISFIDTSTKERLQIIGVDYQPGGSSGFDATTGKDVLSDGPTCLRDAVLLQKLGVCLIQLLHTARLTL